MMNRKDVGGIGCGRPEHLPEGNGDKYETPPTGINGPCSEYQGTFGRFAGSIMSMDTPVASG